MVKYQGIEVGDDEETAGKKDGVDAMYPAVDRDGMVKKQDACPKCGEQRTDYLVWQPPTYDDKIKCTTCGTVYDLP